MVRGWKERLCPIWILRLCLSVTGTISLGGQPGTPAKPWQYPRSPYDPPPHRTGFHGFGSTWQFPCPRRPQATVRILVWHLLSLIFPCVETLQRAGILAPFCRWILPRGEADGAVDWPGPLISHFWVMFCTCSTDGCRSPAAPFGSWLPKSSRLSNSFENLKLIKRNKQGRGIAMLLYQTSPLRSKPIATAASTRFQFQLDLYLPTALHNPQRHQVAT